ncbi:hypothetical protein [Aeromonas sp. MdU4]|uniref:hypothetical protein n=1 Tax=Aeromonas sp. MdU4 TaxID=3342819 RepID=UPI0035BA8212
MLIVNCNPLISALSLMGADDVYSIHKPRSYGHSEAGNNVISSFMTGLAKGIICLLSEFASVVFIASWQPLLFILIDIAMQSGCMDLLLALGG